MESQGTDVELRWRNFLGYVNFKKQEGDGGKIMVFLGR
jgi:hypothetical protein